MSACYEDLGNYDYSPINEIAIEGISEEYNVFFSDSFQLSPNLTFTLDPGGEDQNYDYEWFVINKAGVLPAEKKKDLSTEKDLNILVSLTPGKYTLYYRVLDKQSGIQWQQTCDFNVKSNIFEGWLVLNDVAGEARLDMISLINDKDSLIKDVLGFTHSSLELTGKPKGVYTYHYDPNQYGIYVSTTGNGTTKIDPETFGWSTTQHLSYEFISKPSPTILAEYMQNNSSFSCFVYSEGNMYFYLRVMQVFYGVPINIVQGEEEPFEVAPFVGEGGYGNSILYDNTNKRFVQFNFNATNCTLMPEGEKFDFNTGKDLVYMIRSDFNSGEVFAILKDTDSGKHYLGRVTEGTAKQTYYNEMPATDIDQAENFAIDPVFGYIFYNVGSKVYEYDFSLKQSKLMLDYGSSEITCLKFNGSKTDNTKLIVCSYDPAGETGKSGKMELFSVMPVNGPLELYESHEGLAKVVDVAYRER
ncbi:PKD-like family lipoprotein [Rapidithrix thailandica]|uniref:PKD-like family lipoprotein n=1 Tax=Rapidithrix thailandica TaxID=413964 RepID=A0AAW9S4X7_9BACT